MKATIKLKSFPDHAGIPGHQGGSLPRDVIRPGSASTPFATTATLNSFPHHKKVDDTKLQEWDTKYPDLWDKYSTAATPTEVGKVKKLLLKQSDEGKSPYSDGAIITFAELAVDKLKNENSSMTVRTPAENRIDRILHITNSEGKRTSRKMN